MSKEKKGHEREAYGFKITTSPAANDWAVHITTKAKGKVRTEPGIERDGFKHEGEALDWAEDWATTNRIYRVVIVSKDHGLAAEVTDELEIPLWTSEACAEEGEARNRADTYIKARRAHDQVILAARQRNRADYRLVLEDVASVEAKAQAAIETAKATIKGCTVERVRLHQELRSPQVTFNFVAAVELIRDGKASEAASNILSGLGIKGPKDPRQTDIEDANKARGRKPPEAPAP